jgi:dolichol-phosphate mannosyltransferase
VAWTAARLTAGAVAAWRLARAATARPQVLPDPDPLDGTSVSVIVPARNESARIGRLLAALAHDPTKHEVIVVDDESTDDTATVAAVGGAVVVPGAPLPPGWVGKPWALHQGLLAAGSEWVVTLDADTIPRAGLLAALVRRAEADRWDLLSVAARIECTGLQLVLHPAMLTTLVYRFGPPGPSRPLAPHRAVANGQCTVYRRDHLLEAGGYAGVAGHLTDDVALARFLAARGDRVGFLDGTGAVNVRMYASAGEAWREWGRSLAMPDVTRPASQAFDLAVVWLAQALPMVRMAIGRADVLDLVLVLARLGTLAGTHRAYAWPDAAYWASPLVDVAVAARLTQVAIRPETAWRGRHYPTAAGRGAF